MLRRWAQQLGNNDDQEDGPLRKRARLASDEPPATPTAFRRVGRPRKSEGQAKDTPVGSRSWGFILALQKIEIPSVLAEQLHPHKSHNPAQFLADVAIPATEGAPKLDVLIRLCGYVHEMPRKEAMDTVCRLFFVLMLADMASYVFEEEDWWNQRNHGIEEKVRSPGATGKTTVNMIKQEGQLAFICQQLSTGCLFWLYSELGDNL